MKAKLTSTNETNQYNFEISIDEAIYAATIYTNNKGKFIDWEVTDVDGDFVDTTIEDKVIDYIDKNWNTLVK